MVSFLMEPFFSTSWNESSTDSLYIIIYIHILYKYMYFFFEFTYGIYGFV